MQAGEMMPDGSIYAGTVPTGTVITQEMIDALKAAAISSLPMVRPSDGDLYFVVCSREAYDDMHQWEWRMALEKAKRQLSKLRYWH